MVDGDGGDPLLTVQLLMSDLFCCITGHAA